MKQKSLLVGNWKLNNSMQASIKLVTHLKEALKDLNSSEAIQIAVAPVATQLSKIAELSKNTYFQVAAQNVFYETQGAFTGEWSVQHLSELGVSMAIVGHSERRQYFGEDSKSVALKAQALLKENLTPIICVGENLEQREAGQTEAHLASQLEPVLSLLNQEDLAKSVIAYEPIWAIGTGKTASVSQVDEVHTWLRERLGRSRLLYGGSVKPSNAAELFGVSNVNGFLVGGASLEADSFLKILSAMNSVV